MIDGLTPYQEQRLLGALQYAIEQRHDGGAREVPNQQEWAIWREIYQTLLGRGLIAVSGWRPIAAAIKHPTRIRPAGVSCRERETPVAADGPRRIHTRTRR